MCSTLDLLSCKINEVEACLSIVDADFDIPDDVFERISFIKSSHFLLLLPMLGKIVLVGFIKKCTPKKSALLIS